MDVVVPDDVKTALGIILSIHRIRKDQRARSPYIHKLGSLYNNIDATIDQFQPSPFSFPTIHSLTINNNADYG